MLKPGIAWGEVPPVESQQEENDAYLHVKVNTASPAELTNMTFEFLLRAIDTSIALAVNDQWADALKPAIRAQSALAELRSVLDPSVGDLAVHLDAQYAWAYGNLIQGTGERDLQKLRWAREAVAPIAEAFEAISKAPV